MSKADQEEIKRMTTEELAEFIRERIPEDHLLLHLIEEATELAAAASRLIRVKRLVLPDEEEAEQTRIDLMDSMSDVKCFSDILIGEEDRLYISVEARNRLKDCAAILKKQEVGENGSASE